MKQSGFTLVEVLVAMLVLAIGLLGLAGLMTSSLRNNLSASHRTQATWLAYDIIDRMRANRTSAIAGSYATTLATSGACTVAWPTGTIQAQDIAAWKSQLACVLPTGNGSIAVTNAARATVMIRWDDRRGSQGLTNQTFTVETQL
jgi:type IV pilus assembly protein PilV